MNVQFNRNTIGREKLWGDSQKPVIQKEWMTDDVTLKIEIMMIQIYTVNIPNIIISHRRPWHVYHD